MKEKKFLEAYYNKLNEALETSEASFIFNRDRSHNSTIMRFMFDKSHEIYMFCGSMSVFRKGFYEKIGTDEKNNYAKEIANEAENSLVDSMRKFFAKDGAKLFVILENYNPAFLKDVIDVELFKDNRLKGKLMLYKLDESFTFKKRLSHFSSSDIKIVRLEQDKEEHSAVCIVNDDSMLKSSKSMFKKLINVATLVEWPQQN